MISTLEAWVRVVYPTGNGTIYLSDREFYGSEIRKAEAIDALSMAEFTDAHKSQVTEYFHDDPTSGGERAYIVRFSIDGDLQVHDTVEDYEDALSHDVATIERRIKEC